MKKDRSDAPDASQFPKNSTDFGRVVFCDSGLGGMDVAANFLAGIRHGCRVKELEIIVFNAWPRPGIGFNQLPDLRTKLAALHQVNEAIRQLDPTLVVYACNTISTLLADGDITLPFPSQTMLGAATKLLIGALQKNPGKNLLICGTATTAASRFYSRQLVKMGWDAQRIVELGCPGLATQIESAPNGATVQWMIRSYARQAAKRLGNQDLLLGLCCTHFGYSDCWKKEFAKFFNSVTILNPNKDVVQEMLPAWRGNDRPRITAKFLTRVDVSPVKRAAIAPFLRARAPELAAALSSPIRDKALFIF